MIDALALRRQGRWLMQRQLDRLVALRAGLRSYPLRTVLIWLLAIAILGDVVVFDPALAVFLSDPELLMTWLLLAVAFLRRRPHRSRG